MKYSAVAVVVGATAFVAAQNPMDNISKCVQGCVGPLLAESKTCKLSDIKCICGDAAFIQGISTCVSEKCEKEDLKAAFDFAKGFCQTAGAPLPEDLVIPGLDDSATTTTTVAPGATAPAEDDDAEEEDDEEPTPSGADNATVTAPVPTNSGTAPPDSAAGTVMISGLSLCGAAFAAVFML